MKARKKAGGTHFAGERLEDGCGVHPSTRACESARETQNARVDFCHSKSGQGDDVKHLLQKCHTDVYLSVSFACLRAHARTITTTTSPFWRGCGTADASSREQLPNCRATLILSIGRAT